MKIATFAICAALMLAPQAQAQSLSSFSNQDMTGALKEALSSASTAAVSKLGQQGGFLNNPQVRIPLPAALAKAQIAMRAMGMGGEADKLEVAMNHAAEQAVPEAKGLLLESVNKMTVRDAQKILTGGNEAGTAYFKRTTEASLTQKFEPIVKQVVDRNGLAQSYDTYAGKLASMGLLTGQQASVSAYVTQKALDGLYFEMGQEEAAIRKNPMQRGGGLVSSVFGALLK